jgi:hypothetical protein
VSAPLQPTLPPHSEAFLAEINAQLKQQLEAKTRELEYAQMKIRILEEHLRLRRIARYGPGSEKLSNLQLHLLEEEPGASSEEVQAEGQREALPKPDEKNRQRRAHPGRQTLPADLPRVEKVVACTAEQCVCGQCGAETKVFGYDESEVLCVKPAEYYVEVIRREKRACRPGPPATGLRRWGGGSARSRAWPWRRCLGGSSTRAWSRTASSSTRL